MQEIWDPRTIQLQHLVEISFGFVDVNYAIKVLSLFELPSIQNFRLEDVAFTLNPMDYPIQNVSPILDWLTSRYEPSADDPRPSTAISRAVCGT